MRKFFLGASCLVSLIGCMPPSAISGDQLPSGASITSQPNQTVAARSGFRVVGNVLYFLGTPPDKTRRNEFKDQKTFDVYFANLFDAVKKRNPVQDARHAFNNGVRYFITSNGTGPSQRGRGNPLGLGTPEMAKLCPNAFGRLAWLEGYRLAINSCSPGDGSSCGKYGLGTDDYQITWNKEMARLCLGGR